mgnify:CR=1
MRNNWQPSYPNHGLQTVPLLKAGGRRYYQWKSQYGGMEASDLKRVRELESKNAKLKRMYAELV